MTRNVRRCSRPAASARTARRCVRGRSVTAVAAPPSIPNARRHRDASATPTAAADRRARCRPMGCAILPPATSAVRGLRARDRPAPVAAPTAPRARRVMCVPALAPEAASRTRTLAARRICVPDVPPGCRTADDCVSPQACTTCPDGTPSCAQAECLDGMCVAQVPALLRSPVHHRRRVRRDAILQRVSQRHLRVCGGAVSQRCLRRDLPALSRSGTPVAASLALRARRA